MHCPSLISAAPEEAFWEGQRGGRRRTGNLWIAARAKLGFVWPRDRFSSPDVGVSGDLA